MSDEQCKRKKCVSCILVKLEIFHRSFDLQLKLRWWGYLKEDGSPVGEGGHGEAAYRENNRAAGIGDCHSIGVIVVVIMIMMMTMMMIISSTKKVF